jgi:hypothetical protein
MSKKWVSSARDVAEVAEAAARMAIERAQVAERQPDQFAADRLSKHELTQMREENDLVLQSTQEIEQTVRKGTTPQNVDVNKEEENDSEAH